MNLLATMKHIFLISQIRVFQNGNVIIGETTKYISTDGFVVLWMP